MRLPGLGQVWADLWSLRASQVEVMNVLEGSEREAKRGEGLTKRDSVRSAFSIEEEGDPGDND